MAEPFRIEVRDEVLADLKQRLSHVRYPIDFNNDNWAYGTNRAYLERLVDYWREQYDWRKHEAEINRYAHYRTVIDGVPVHFIHERGKGPKPIPLILSHGWPWTFWDLQKVIRPLADPAAFGGDPADAFDVVVPSLPGFCFSTPLMIPGINCWRTADMWVTLMRDVLGYSKFAAEGGDWGAFITAQLGHKYPQHLIAIYLTLAIPLSFFSGGAFKESDYGPDEQAALTRTREARPTIISHVAVQTRDPQTLAYGMHDSPVALLAWMLERRRAWSDCGGNVERRYSKDELLTHVMLYWVTECFVTSVRYYFEAREHLWKPEHDRKPVIESPTAIGVFPRELLIPPRKWAEEYYNLQQWTPMTAGGHFAPSEEPEQLVADIRKFYRRFR